MSDDSIFAAGYMSRVTFATPERAYPQTNPEIHNYNNSLDLLLTKVSLQCIKLTKPVADPAISVGGSPPPTPLCQNIGAPLKRKFKLYINHCHRDPVSIIFINMPNSLFRLLIPYDELH